MIWRLCLIMTRAWLLGQVMLLGCPVAFAAGPAPAPVPARLPATDCLLVDMDGNLDDLRAIAVIVPFSQIRAVVATDGMMVASQGAAMLMSFLAYLPASQSIPIITGASRAVTSPAPPAWNWLADARADANRIQSALGTLPVAQPRNHALAPQVIEQRVAASTKGCKAIGLLMIGPWSSFLYYQSSILDRLAFVVAQGRSPFDATPVGNLEWDRVNCKFDRDACAFAQGVLRQVPVYWVDLPDVGPRFPVTKEMIGGLMSTPLALALKRVLLDDPALAGQQQWDDLAAVFMLHPDAFQQEGQHFLPRLDPHAMQELERTLISGQR